MRTTVEIPKSALDEATKKRLQALERKLSNAEKKADSWKMKAKRLEAEVRKMSLARNLIYELASEMDMNPCDEEYDADWRRVRWNLD